MLKAYFLSYDLTARQQVKTITIDMYSPYIQLVQRCFTNAKIIIDHFHLVQALNRELNRVRVQTMNALRTTDGKQYRKLKRYWKLILKDRDELNATSYQKFSLFPSWTNTQAIVDILLTDSTLKSIYDTVQTLRSTLKESDWESFQATLTITLKTALPKGLNRVLRTFRTYLPYIQHTFTYPDFTNGPIEGHNNKIKVLKRIAFDYRNYSNFRDRILLMCRLYVPDSTKTTKQHAAA